MNADKVFFVDHLGQIDKSYQDLFDDLSATEILYFPVCYTSDYYEIFKQIIVSLLLDKEIVILDSELPESELKRFMPNGIPVPELCYNPHTGLNYDTFLGNLDSLQNWCITLFTSGTTGQPKSVSHAIQSITKAVKISSKHADSIWGYAFNPTHIAGIQVFFQALLNRSSIIRIYDYAQADILNCLSKYQITHISATPTFYRLLVDGKSVFPNVKGLTFGGEKYDINLTMTLEKMFPSAKFLNVYASTEAGTLFSAEGDIFTLNDETKDYIKIEDNEILVHESAMGNLPRTKIENGWYSTGDVVEIISENPTRLVIVARKNEMVNIGGYIVNPNEVEEIILAHPQIQDVIVFSKPNSVVGNILCCDIVLNKTDSLSVKDLKKSLALELQSFKVPRIINFIGELQNTRTGKKKRV